MAKRYGRPSAQYRYEHYDPTPLGKLRITRTPDGVDARPGFNLAVAL